MSALDDVNKAFHDAYDSDREKAANDDPILVVLADELVLFRGKHQTRFTVTTPALTAVKSIAHAPVALWLLLQHGGTEKQVAKLRTFIINTLERGDDPILTETLAWLDRMPFDPSAFGAALGPKLLASIAHATKLQLASLHEKTEEALALLNAEERSKLHVAVTGDHQARIRSLGMQYFQKRFQDEDRVLYAEGVEDAKEAAALVGTQRLAHALAAAFFGDPRRMQRDLLGDAAKTELASFDLRPIDRG